MPNPRHKLSFKLFGILSGEAEGLFAISVLAVLILAVAGLWRFLG